MIGDPQVRNWGTIGGSIAHADPAADWPAVVLALGAEIKVTGPKGARTIKADDFFKDVMTTALGADEVLTEIRIPAPAAGSGTAYVKHPHPASRFAVVGALTSARAIYRTSSRHAPIVTMTSARPDQNEPSDISAMASTLCVSRRRMRVEMLARPARGPSATLIT